MKCHDGEECKLGCTEDRMQCAMPVSIVYELRTDTPIYQKRAAVIADYVEKLEDDLAAAQRELAAWRKAVEERTEEMCCGNCREGDKGEPVCCCNPTTIAEITRDRVSELLAQEGVPAQPQYREPTLEDAQALYSTMDDIGQQGGRFTDAIFHALKQLGFVRKVQP